MKISWRFVWTSSAILLSAIALSAVFDEWVQPSPTARLIRWLTVMLLWSLTVVSAQIINRQERQQMLEELERLKQMLDSTEPD